MSHLRLLLAVLLALQWCVLPARVNAQTPPHTASVYFDIGYCVLDQYRDGWLDLARVPHIGQDTDSDGILDPVDPNVYTPGVGYQFVSDLHQPNNHRINTVPLEVLGEGSAVNWQFEPSDDDAIPTFNTNVNQIQGFVDVSITQNGVVETVRNNFANRMDRFSLSPFDDLDVTVDGVTTDLDVATGVSYLHLASGASYTIDMDGRCVEGSTAMHQYDITVSSAAEWNTVTDEFGADRTYETARQMINIGADGGDLPGEQLLEGASGAGTGHRDTYQYNVSEVDMYGFSFQGNVVIDLTADVVGNIVFDANDRNFSDDRFDGDAGDVTFTYNSGSVLYGDIVLGERDHWLNDGSSDSTRAGSAAHDVVLTNHGVVQNVDLRNTDNVVFTNTGTVGTPGGYGVDATNVGTGIRIINSGDISNIDGSDTKIITITNEATGTIDGILLNDNANASTLADPDIRTTVTNAGVLTSLIADRVGILNITNTGTISSLLDEAIVLSNNGTVSFTTSGLIAASSSNAIDFTNYSGTMSLDNSNSITASTNNTIYADGSAGDYTFNNSGTISNTNNRAISMRNMAGEIEINNTGTISSNQTTVSFTSDTPLNAGSATVINSSNGTIVANFGHAVEAENIADIVVNNSGTMSSNAYEVLQLDSVVNIDIENSGTLVTRVAELLSAASSIDFDLVNSGTIGAFNNVIDLTDASGSISIENSGIIAASHALSSASSGSPIPNYVIYANRAAGGAGSVVLSNASSGSITINSDRAIAFRDFSGAGDSIAITNAGTVSAGRDWALDLFGSASATILNTGSLLSGGSNTIDLRSANGSVDITNGASGVIMAGGAQAIRLGSASGSITIVNAGSISAGSSTIHSTLDTGANSVFVNNSGLISASGSDALHLLQIASSPTVINTGTIRAGVEGSDDPDETGDNALALDDITGADITNSGRIVATNNRAIFLGTEGSDNPEFLISNSGADSSIVAQDEVVFIDLNGASGATLVFVNEGTIRASASNAAHVLNFDGFSEYFHFTNSGTILSTGDGAVVGDLDHFALTSASANWNFRNLSGGTISADAETVHFSSIEERVYFSNAGTIEAVSSGTAGASAVTIADIGNNTVTFRNEDGGEITANGENAVQILGYSSGVTFFNGSGATIEAADRTLVLERDTGNPTIVFDNRGTIRATSASASHVVRLQDFAGNLNFDNRGIIFSAGSGALYLASGVGTDPEMDFDNIGGTVETVTGNAAEILGFSSGVNIFNSGTIKSRSGGTALLVDAGKTTVFSNSGRIEASDGHAVHFQNFRDASEVDNEDVPDFTNQSTGIITSASHSFFMDSSVFYDAPYRFANHGSIVASSGSHAVNLGDKVINFVNSGTISATASPAVALGSGSTIDVTGTIQAGGTMETVDGDRSVAILLGASGSVITLRDGANVIGDIAVASGTLAPASAAQKHQVALQGVTNASYYFDFNSDYFTFSIDGQPQNNASGFSAATTLYTALPILHQDHGKMHRKNFRSLSKFVAQDSLKTIGFSGSSDAKKTAKRNAKVSGDRSGFVQSIEQSIFDLFDAELIFATGNGSYSVDSDIFTVSRDYTGFGLGFRNLLNFGPFSVSAMGMSGVSDNSVSRLVYSNETNNGQFRINSSFDTTHFDAVYEAMLKVRVYGPGEKLTRRKPYRAFVELGVGGSVHSAISDGFSEESYVSTAKNTTESNSSGARIKAELEFRNPFDRRHLYSFLEFETVEADITKGNSYAYTVEGVTKTSVAPAQKTTNNVISAGLVFDIDEDISVSFTHASTEGNTEVESSRSNVSFKWRF